MTITVTMNETELCDAMAEWLKSKGMSAVGRPLFRSTVDDRPNVGPSVSMVVTVEQLPPGNPQR